MRVALFLMILTGIIYMSWSRLTAPNYIEDLSEILQPITEVVPDTEKVYYFSNDHNALFFRTQFVLIPRVLVNNINFKKIPIGAYILMIRNKRERGEIKYFYEEPPQKALLFEKDNRRFHIQLYTKP